MIRGVIGEHIYWKGDGAMRAVVGQAIKDCEEALLLPLLNPLPGVLYQA